MAMMLSGCDDDDDDNGNDDKIICLLLGAYRNQQYMFWFGPMIGASLTALFYGKYIDDYNDDDDNDADGDVHYADEYEFDRNDYDDRDV